MSLRISDVNGKFTFLGVLGVGGFSVVCDVEFVMHNAPDRMARMALKWGFINSSSGSTAQEHANVLRVLEWDYTPKSVGYIRHDTETFFVDDLFSNAEKAAQEIRAKLAGKTFSLKREGTLSKARQFVLLLPRMDGDLDHLQPQMADLPLIDQALDSLCRRMAQEQFDHGDFRPRNMLVCVDKDEKSEGRGLFSEVVLGDWGSARDARVSLDALLREKDTIMEDFERRAGIRQRRS